MRGYICKGHRHGTAVHFMECTYGDLKWPVVSDCDGELRIVVIIINKRLFTVHRSLHEYSGLLVVQCMYKHTHVYRNIT